MASISVGGRHHFVGGELDRRLGDLPVFVGEILRRENILRLALFGEEAAALCTLCHHRRSIVAIAIPSLVQTFENSRGAHAAAHAHGHHAVPRLAALHFLQQPGGQLGAGAAQRMPQRDGAAVDIHPSVSRPSVLMTASDWAANASFNSMIRSDRASAPPA